MCSACYIPGGGSVPPRENQRPRACRLVGFPLQAALAVMAAGLPAARAAQLPLFGKETPKRSPTALCRLAHRHSPAIRLFLNPTHLSKTKLNNHLRRCTRAPRVPFLGGVRQDWCARNLSPSPRRVSQWCARAPLRSCSLNSRSGPGAAELSGDVRVECASEHMRVAVRTRAGAAFSGLIYPRGLSKNSSCLAEFVHSPSPVSYRLPLRSCNTMSSELDDGGIEYFNTIVVQPHLKLVTNQGRGFHVRCRYQPRDRTVSNAMNVS
ncbi:Cuticlin [Gryllus bimaculatus]|nr:Cuticlin [Gryllus bimaculatus]